MNERSHAPRDPKLTWVVIQEGAQRHAELAEIAVRSVTGAQMSDSGH